MKLSPEEKIRQVAKETAQNLIDVANATSAALATSTKESIISIQADIKEINSKLDGRFVTKEEYEPIQADHETRLRFIEKYGFMILGAIVLAEVVIGWIVVYKR